MVPLVWLTFLGPLILVPYWWREILRKVSLRILLPESWGLPRTQLALSAEDQRTQNPSGVIVAVSGINKRTDKKKRGSRKETHENQRESRGCPKYSTTSFQIPQWWPSFALSERGTALWGPSELRLLSQAGDGDKKYLHMLKIKIKINHDNSWFLGSF